MGRLRSLSPWKRYCPRRNVHHVDDKHDEGENEGRIPHRERERERVGDEMNQSAWSAEKFQTTPMTINPATASMNRFEGSIDLPADEDPDDGDEQGLPDLRDGETSPRSPSPPRVPRACTVRSHTRCRRCIKSTVRRFRGRGTLRSERPPAAGATEILPRSFEPR